MTDVDVKGRVFDENGLLSKETLSEAERILTDRPDLLTTLLTDLSTIVRNPADGASA